MLFHSQRFHVSSVDELPGKAGVGPHHHPLHGVGPDHPAEHAHDEHQEGQQGEEARCVKNESVGSGINWLENLSSYS